MKRKKFIVFALMAAVILGFSSCSKDNDEPKDEISGAYKGTVELSVGTMASYKAEKSHLCAKSKRQQYHRPHGATGNLHQHCNGRFDTWKLHHQGIGIRRSKEKLHKGLFKRWPGGNFQVPKRWRNNYQQALQV